MIERFDNVISWASILEDQARAQAITTSKMPFLAGPLALMPDAHFGMGATVGSVIATQGAIIPAAVGVDIGCGMAAVETDIFASGLPDDATKMLNFIETVVPAGVGRGHNRDNGLTLSLDDIPDNLHKTASEQFGSLGSGNHFVEVCLDERDRVWIVLHSGSRGVGNKLAQRHIDIAKGLMREWFIALDDPDLAYLVQSTPQFDDYLRDLNWAQEYARLNREKMLDAVMTQFWGWVGVGEHEHVGHETSRVNCHHNYTQMEHHRGKDVWLTRKGAISAREGQLGIIPGSMGASSYIVSGLGNELSYQSCSHGAGRRLSRNAARKVVTAERLSEEMRGKAWLERDAAKLVDEAPEAYKDIDTVMNDQRDLVEIRHTLRQIVNYKGL